VVTAKTPAGERDAVVRGFRGGSIPVVCNVGVLTLGFDYPELSNIILARPTMSLALYYQMVGRGVRPHPSKQSTFVVDMVGLSDMFGPVEDLTVEWGDHDKWIVTSGGRQLTNIYYRQRNEAA